MKLNLNKAEEQVLVVTLDSSLNRLKDEIAHTDAYDYRELLKQRKEILLKLRGKLH